MEFSRYSGWFDRSVGYVYCLKSRIHEFLIQSLEFMAHRFAKDSFFFLYNWLGTLPASLTFFRKQSIPHLFKHLRAYSFFMKKRAEYNFYKMWGNYVALGGYL